MATANGWNELTLRQVFYAYRKAKADAFFDRVIGSALRFAEYEKDLARNLRKLHERLSAGEVANVLAEGLGKPRPVAKSLKETPKERLHTDTHEVTPKAAEDERFGMNGEESHVYFSDPRRAIQQLKAQQDLSPELRLVGDFSVDFHIVSALWISLVGHEFDSALGTSSYGTRLQRYQTVEDKDNEALGEYSHTAIGSFKQYFGPYQAWRDDGMAALRRELEADNRVVAVTLDFASFYHRVDPMFILDEEFQSICAIELNSFQTEFTKALCGALADWTQISPVAQGRSENTRIGLPIGLSAARIIANVALIGFDRKVKENLAPIFYGRYVDDVFLVLRDTEIIQSGNDIIEYVLDHARIGQKDPPAGHESVKSIVLELPHLGDSILELQPSKQRVFVLAGQGGIDLLDVVASQVQSVASERRLLPLPDELDSSASAMVLTATNVAGEEAVTLGKSTGLTIRRLGWSVQLRSVETLAKALPKSEWSKQRKKFYDFAINHVIRVDRVFEHMSSLTRLVTLATSLKEWDELGRIVRRLQSALNELEATAHGERGSAAGNPAPAGSGPKSLFVNGQSITNPRDASKFWREFRNSVNVMVGEAILRAVPLESLENRVRPVDLPEWVRRLTGIALQILEAQELVEDQQTVLDLREADLAAISYKEHLRSDATTERQRLPAERILYGCYEHIDDLRLFLLKSRLQSGGATRRISPRIRYERLPSLVPHLCPTRPYNPEEISLYLPNECIFDRSSSRAPLARWARYSQAMKGGSLPPKLAESLKEAIPSDADSAKNPPPTNPADVYDYYDGSTSKQQVHLGIPSLLTKQASWHATASGSSDRSLERYKRILAIVNLALTSSPQPTHLLLPELSLPEAWIQIVADRLLSSKISLIAGLDYHHENVSPPTQIGAAVTHEAHKDSELPGNFANDSASKSQENTVHSSAVLVLRDDRLGFSRAVQIRQPKVAPAPGEEQELLQVHGKTWNPTVSGELLPAREAIRKRKPTYHHQGFTFGVLICSELQNVRHRTHFQGNIDLLMVLSWNRDLSTFNALVNAASLDMHTYVALVNNRKYGGSRVRAPAKEDFRRELCHVHGGENDHLVVVKLDTLSLRKFQSRSKRWPTDEDLFKAVPEDFVISSQRRHKWS